MSCDNCACEAKVETAWGDTYCGWCYSNAPTTDPCPNCNSERASVTPVDVEGSSDAPAPAHSPVGAGAVIRPSLDMMLASLRLCVQFYEDEAHEPSEGVIDVSLHSLGVFRDAVTACIEYRRLRHDPADEPGYQVIHSDVPDVLMELASSVMRRVAR